MDEDLADRERQRPEAAEEVPGFSHKRPYGHPLQVLPLGESPEGFPIHPSRGHLTRLSDTIFLPPPRLAEKVSDPRFEIAADESVPDEVSDRVPRAEPLKPEEVREAAFP